MLFQEVDEKQRFIVVLSFSSIFCLSLFFLPSRLTKRTFFLLIFNKKPVISGWSNLLQIYESPNKCNGKTGNLKLKFNAAKLLKAVSKLVAVCHIVVNLASKTHREDIQVFNKSFSMNTSSSVPKAP